MEGYRKYDDYDNGSLGEMGYQAQAFDDESGELVSTDDDDEYDDAYDDADDAFVGEEDF